MIVKIFESRYGRLVKTLPILMLFMLIADPQSVRAGVVAIVNGDSITTNMMAMELGRIHMTQAGAVRRGDYSAERLLERLVNNRLLTQEAKSIGLAEDSSLIDEVKQHRESLAYAALLRESTPDTISSSDDEVVKTFNRLYERFDLRSVCVTDSAQAFELADSIRRGAAMDKMAKAVSIDGYKDNGGLAEKLTLTQLPSDIWPALTNGQIGDIIGPRNLWRMWATFRIEKRMPADTARLDSMKDELRRYVILQKRDEYHKQYVQRLRQSIAVVVDTAQVDSVMIRLVSGKDEPDTPVATVAGTRVLTAKSLQNKYVHKIAGRYDREPRNVLYELVAEQVDIMVLKEAAEREEVVSRPEFDAPCNAFRDSVLVARYLEDVVAPAATVSDSEVIKYFDQHRSAYHGPTQYRIATLTRAKREEIDADYQAATAGTDFAWLVRRSSIDAFKDKDGVRDWLPADVFPPSVFAEMDSLPIGGITHPTAVDEGFVIMKILDRKPGDPLTLDKVSEQIKSKLTAGKQMKAIDETIRLLRASAKIQIFEDVMKGLQISAPVESAGDSKGN